jgi:AcrR family transcriptional regulator
VSASVAFLADESRGTEATRRRLSPRQAEAVAQLVQAAVDEVEEVGYEGVTVRNVARRAGLAPATAYTYFSSKDHLLAEVLWRGMEALPAMEVDPEQSVRDRVAETVRAMVLLATESAALVDASTQALVSSNPDVKHLRDRIGNQIHRRLAAAVGPGVDPLVVRVLETSFAGALLTAGTGHMSSIDIPEFVAGAAELMTEPRVASEVGPGQPRTSRRSR